MHAVATGADAIKALFDALLDADVLPYRLILMDCHLPDMDGLECTKRIRELEKQKGLSRRIPIVGMTGLGTSLDRQKCLDAGMDDFISKPFELQNFSELLWNWVIVSHTDKYLNDSLSGNVGEG